MHDDEAGVVANGFIIRGIDCDDDEWFLCSGTDWDKLTRDNDIVPYYVHSLLEGTVDANGTPLVPLSHVDMQTSFASERMASGVKSDFAEVDEKSSAKTETAADANHRLVAKDQKEAVLDSHGHKRLERLPGVDALEMIAEADPKTPVGKEKRYLDFARTFVPDPETTSYVPGYEPVPWYISLRQWHILNLLLEESAAVAGVASSAVAKSRRMTEETTSCREEDTGS